MPCPGPVTAALPGTGHRSQVCARLAAHSPLGLSPAAWVAQPSPVGTPSLGQGEMGAGTSCPPWLMGRPERLPVLDARAEAAG